MYMLRTVKPK